MDAEQVANQKGLELKSEIPTELPLVLGSASRLQQVLNNLLQNAIKFTMAPGTIVCRLSYTNNEVKVEVMDTGIGIKTEELPKIFDDFYHGTTIEAEGAGLGLYICKKIIRSHGGKIWAESPCPETGRGTRLSFTLLSYNQSGAEEKSNTD